MVSAGLCLALFCRFVDESQREWRLLPEPERVVGRRGDVRAYNLAVSTRFIAAGLIIAALVGAGLAWLLQPTAVDDTPTIRTQFTLPDSVGTAHTPQVIVAVSRDGRSIAAVTQSAA